MHLPSKAIPPTEATLLLGPGLPHPLHRIYLLARRWQNRSIEPCTGTAGLVLYLPSDHRLILILIQILLALKSPLDIPPQMPLGC